MQALGVDREERRRAAEMFGHDLVDLEQRHLDDALDLDVASRHARHVLGLFLRERVPGRLRHQVVIGLARGRDADARLERRVLRPHRAQLLAHLDVRLDEHPSEAALVEEVGVVDRHRIVRAHIHVRNLGDPQVMKDEIGDQILAALCEGEHSPRVGRRPCRPLPRSLAARPLVEGLQRHSRRNRAERREEFLTSQFHGISCCHPGDVSW